MGSAGPFTTFVKPLAAMRSLRLKSPAEMPVKMLVEFLEKMVDIS
jgi:hypothetical protein